MAERLILVRHGACEGGGDGRLVGLADASLTVAGELQAERLAGRLRLPPGARLLSSPLLRARQTAAIVVGKRAGSATTAGGEPAAAVAAGQAGAPAATVEIEAGLREVDFGRWEGLRVDDVAASYPRELSEWAAWDTRFSFPGGEPLAGFLARVDELAGRLLQDPAPAVVCFSHAGVIRALLCRVLGLPSDKYVVFDVRPAGVALLTVHGDACVLRGLLNLEDDEWAL